MRSFRNLPLGLTTAGGAISSTTGAFTRLAGRAEVGRSLIFRGASSGACSTGSFGWSSMENVKNWNVKTIKWNHYEYENIINPF